MQTVGVAVRNAAEMCSDEFNARLQVNMSCTILHFVSDPNWRPTFRLSSCKMLQASR